MLWQLGWVFLAGRKDDNTARWSVSETGRSFSEYINSMNIYAMNIFINMAQDRICLNRKGQDWALRNLISDKPKPALLSPFTWAPSHFTLEIASIRVYFILCLQLELSNFLIYWVLRPWDIAVQGCCTFGKHLSPCAVCPGIQHHPRTPNFPIFLQFFFF